MKNIIGIKSEDKSIWEKRTPIIPLHISELKKRYDINFIIQQSEIRVFDNEKYIGAGAKVMKTLDDCNIILGIKEMPEDFFQDSKIYIFFSHTIKGQKHNMPMLKKMIEKKCTLIDYEKIVDEQGKRKIFFGRHAGISGMIDTLYLFGRRLKEYKNIDTQFYDVKQSYKYKNLAHAITELKKIRKSILDNGLPQEITPLTIGITGYGNVSKGVQEILSIFPIKEIEPRKLEDFILSKKFDNKHIYKIVFKEEDMVAPISRDIRFELNDYYQAPEKYKSIFDKYVPYLVILMNCIYWDSRYPKFITKKYLKENKNKLRLEIIGDISCDINGAIECNEHATNQNNPSFVYNPILETITDGYLGDGIIIMAIDNLPCELPIDSSTEFSNALRPYIPILASTDFSEEFENCMLPEEIKNAIIVYHGELTPNYKYLKKFIDEI